ncbi:MAG: protein kinase [Okeania sp. SIO2C2]|uniref:protein kinase domain-containing protein n=1 Tax=Okeania sp. SIO2C2 TaxID=2607787 RepID=UPI0013B5FCBC|nr:GUN4 domain-containing protein [Okeania sp. SIO2C2]NEP89520.1 protein kinase [Okeania sp. SIO2C2]
MSQCLNPECLTINPDNFQFCQKCGNKLLLVERYWVKSILGQGGFGRTFLAVDELKPSQPFCVIKQFLPQAQGTENLEKAAELFAQEAERLELLGKHPQIPELFAYFSVDSRQYLVQEFIQGETLQQELDNHGVFNEGQIRELLIDLLSVLQFVHSHNVIHRDIKPENIIRIEADKRLVLVDFGAAKVLPKTQSRTVTGTVIGSAEYCAPEQSMGKAKFGSDLYSLGVVCLHLLTQMSPFDLYDVMEMEWVWRDCLNGNFVSDELGKILDGLVEQKPKQRYQNVEDVLANLGFGNYSVYHTQNHQQSPKYSSATNRLLLPSLPPQYPQDSTHTNIPPVVLRVDYNKLQNLLALGKWEEADKETKRCMLEVARQEKLGFLNVEHIDYFPYTDLCTIDRLWVRYSNGKFGFSVQKKIYQSLGGTRKYNSKVWEAFGDKVGWRKKGKWLEYEDLIFSLSNFYSCNLGYFPLCFVRLQWQGTRWDFTMIWLAWFVGLGSHPDVASTLLSHRDL